MRELLKRARALASHMLWLEWVVLAAMISLICLLVTSEARAFLREQRWRTVGDEQFDADESKRSGG